MRLLRYLLAATLALAPLPIFDAQSGWLPLAISSGYVGPIDINGTAFAFWSTRCASLAYAGNVMDVTDSATGNTAGTRLQCSGGNVSALVSGSACTFVTGNACSTLASTCAVACNVVTLYDQSGNTNCTTACNVTQATNANRPTLTQSCQNGKICLSFNGGGSGSQCLSSPNVSATTVAQPFELTWVANRNGGVGTRNSTVFGASATNNIQAGWSFPGAQETMYAGTATQTNAAVTDGVWHATQQLFSAASSAWYIDGANTVVSATPGTSGVDNANPMSVGCNSGGGNGFADTFWLETGIWPADKTANNSTMNSNQHAFWNF